MPRHPIKIDLTCKHCGKQYVVRKLARAQSKFCSSKCFGADRKKRNGVEITCRSCGSKFIIKKSSAESGRLFCSKQCFLERTDLLSFEDRLCLNSKKDNGTGCILWTGNTDTDGYGAIGKGDCGRHKTHRAIYGLAYGQFDFSLHVLHSCDNPSCIKPDHLFLGTHDGNMKDMAKKGRAGRKGDKNIMNAVSTAEIEGIVKMRKEGASIRKTAKLFGVSDYAVVLIAGKTSSLSSISSSSS